MLKYDGGGDKDRGDACACRDETGADGVVALSEYDCDLRAANAVFHGGEEGELRPNEADDEGVHSAELRRKSWTRELVERCY